VTPRLAGARAGQAYSACVSRVVFAVVVACVCSNACADSEKERLKKTTIPTYDTTTGKLRELTYDFNKNGKIDTWTQMDGARAVSTRQDLDEDGKIERWEYYDAGGKLIRVGLSRKASGTADAWAYPNAQGEIERIEVSSTGDEHKIDRWERYEGNVMSRAEEDTNGDGRPDKWEAYANGTLNVASFDENHDGVPDRRLSYDAAGTLVLIEIDADGRGGFKKRTLVR
jgi:hypothetical protein